MAECPHMGKPHCGGAWDGDKHGVSFRPQNCLAPNCPFKSTEEPLPTNIIPLRAPKQLVATLVDSVNRNALSHLLVVGYDGDMSPLVGSSPMTRERAVYLADFLMQYARTLP